MDKKEIYRMYVVTKLRYFRIDQSEVIELPDFDLEMMNLLVSQLGKVVSFETFCENVQLYLKLQKKEGREEIEEQSIHTEEGIVPINEAYPYIEMRNGRPEQRIEVSEDVDKDPLKLSRSVGGSLSTKVERR